jgi:hypothetical protein
MKIIQVPFCYIDKVGFSVVFIRFFKSNLEKIDSLRQI